MRFIGTFSISNNTHEMVRGNQMVSINILLVLKEQIPSVVVEMCLLVYGHYFIFT